MITLSGVARAADPPVAAGAAAPAPAATAPAASPAPAPSSTATPDKTPIPVTGDLQAPSSTKRTETLEPKPGIPPTPKHLEFLKNYVKERLIKAIVMPTYFPQDAAKALSDKIGGKVVTICQNLGELPGTDDIFSFFDRNFKEISDALK